MTKTNGSHTKLIRSRRIITGVSGQKPIDDACMIHDGKKLLRIGRYKDLKTFHAGEIQEMGEVTLTPGLLNAHAHMNLSGLKGKTVSGEGFVPWLLSMIKNNYKETDDTAIKKAITEFMAHGGCGVGDITSVANIKIAERFTQQGLYFTCFCEAFGFVSPALPMESIPYSNHYCAAITGAGHALHTTSAYTVRQIKTQSLQRGLAFSIHLAEHDDEIDMLMGKETKFHELLRQAHMMDETYRPPMESPVAHAERLGLLDRSTLAVHCVKVSDEDIDILAAHGTHVCLCPRSNAFIGVGRAPMEKILAAGINTSLGTDSLASNHDLNLWNELSYFIQDLDQKISIEAAIGLITYNPARALLMDRWLGSLEQGKRFVYAVMPPEVEKLFC